MLSAVYGPAAAAPLVSLSLEHIARTPTQRLGIVYQIVPTYVEQPEGPRDPLEAPGIVLWYQLPLGVGLYLDSLLGGGIDGQPLPLNVGMPATVEAANLVDIVA